MYTIVRIKEATVVRKSQLTSQTVVVGNIDLLKYGHNMAYKKCWRCNSYCAFKKKIKGKVDIIISPILYAPVFLLQRAKLVL